MPASILLLVAGLTVASLPAQAQQWASDEWLQQPVDAATFASFLNFFAYDHRLPLAIEVLSSREVEGVAVEHLSFQSTPGMRVTANLFRPAAVAAGQRLPAMVALHGGLPEGKDSLDRFAAPIARAGWMVLAIDMLYFGERDTGLLDTFMNAEKAERLYNRPSFFLEWITQTVKDTGRAYDVLAQERGADPQRIVLMGISRGGQMSLIAGGADARFAGVAPLIAGHFDALETGHLAPACPANFIGRISPRPLLTINGERDADYDRALSVDPLHALAGDPHEAHWHSMGHTLAVEETVGILIDWLSRVPPRAQ